MFTSEGLCKEGKIDKKKLYRIRGIRIFAAVPFLEMPITKRRITK